MTFEFNVVATLTVCLFTASVCFEFFCLELSKTSRSVWERYQKPGVLASMHAGSAGLIVQRSLYNGAGLAYSALAFRIEKEAAINTRAKYALVLMRASVFSLLGGFALLILSSTLAN